MSEKVEVKGAGGVSFLGLLTILFIGLKLTGYITWSWLWVLSPMWIPAVILLVILLGTLVAAIAQGVKGK